MFLKLFFAAALTRHFDFLLEIPLAHCVRGGMVCAAGREKGKKKGGGRKEFRNPKTYRRRPTFSPLGSRARSTIPPPTVGGGGISSV